MGLVIIYNARDPAREQMNSRDMLGGNFKCVGIFGDVAATNKTRYLSLSWSCQKFASAVTSGDMTVALSTVARAEGFSLFFLCSFVFASARAESHFSGGSP